MGTDVRVTTAVAKVLAALLESPSDLHYGLDLINATGLPSGTLYPILVRLERAGWLDAQWEEIDRTVAGRPARRYYRFTPDGLSHARLELAALYRHLDRARPAPSSEPRRA
jgi:PadR family transcriptional regulator, regulatory protein PadR